MNVAEIEEAFQAGRIDRHYRTQLLDCLRVAAQLSRREGMVQTIVNRARVVQQATTEQEPGDVLRSLESIPGADQRPGTVALFRAVHAGGMLNAETPAELDKVDTFEQLHAIVRAEIQPTLAAAIRDIWRPMQDSFDRGTIVIRPGHRALRSPPNAERLTDGGLAVTCLPISSEFSRLFASENDEQTLALLKRAIERMGRHFIGRWIKSPAGQRSEIKQADRLLRMLRNVGLLEILCNGFASGAADVLNPLHVLVKQVIEQHGVACLTRARQQSMARHHEDFSVFLATFSLPCLAALEDILRRPASKETTDFLCRWTETMPDFGGKGFALDCEYDSKYFTTRYVQDETTPGGPLIDFEDQAFDAAEIAKMQSRNLRLGCPSLGTPHRMLTRALCDAYFAIVLPQICGE